MIIHYLTFQSKFGEDTLPFLSTLNKTRNLTASLHVSVRKTKMDSLVNVSLIVVKPCTEAYVKFSSMEVFVEIVMG